MIRFNHEAESFDDIVAYYKVRATQLLRHDYFLKSVMETSFGALALFTEGMYGRTLTSLYITPQFRGKGLYWSYVRDKDITILTSDDCNLEEYLKYKGIQHEVVNLLDDTYYRTISNYYGAQKASRSGVDYMNHIDEGLALLHWSEEPEAMDTHTLAAYAYHPIFQSDDELAKNFDRLELQKHMSKLELIYAIEYRSVANDYLSKKEISNIDAIRLSPIHQVNWMLYADKIQNYKDFELYHKGTHPRSKELDRYFRNWLERLEIPVSKYLDLKKKLTINPILIRNA